MTRLDTSGVRDHFVYWLYDADDRLLYVGATRNPKARRYDHKREKPWWSDVVRYRMVGPMPQADAWRIEGDGYPHRRPAAQRRPHAPALRVDARALRRRDARTEAPADRVAASLPSPPYPVRAS